MIRPEFKVHMLNAAGVVKARDIATNFSDLLDKLEALGVNGRELALVKTKLEEASFFAKKSIAQNPNNQIEDVQP